jgi:REP element-mobilizing transposase RayT
MVDRLLDEARVGPFYLRQPAIAQMILECLKHHATALDHCQIHAFAIMPNHVHLLLTSQVPVPQLVKSIKGYTARQANVILGRTGEPFWQRETYDHLVETSEGFERIKRYIEMNPVRAGLFSDPADYKYSSASAALVALGG